MRTVSELITIYKAIYGWDVICSPLRSDLEFVKKAKDIVVEEELLRRCICNRMRHQQRIRQIAVDMAVEKLMKKWDIIGSCQDFDSLYETVYNTIARQSYDGKTGLSYCTVYDTSIRIGYTFENKILPDKYVYVHQKLVNNAKELLGKNLVKDRCRILREDFIKHYDAFKHLKSIEIEDFLCLMPLLKGIQVKI